MKKFLVFSGVGVVFITLLVLIIGYLRYRDTKSFSPEKEEVFTDGKVSVKVLYNRPSKKDRTIFGALVPYNKVWRTGANEATTFETNKTLIIGDKKLPPGKYSLWTVPAQENWMIIFNTEHGQWGINDNGEANRDPERDALTVEAHALQQEKVLEQFTISFEKTGEEAEMVLLWDKTVVTLPFSY